MAASASSKSTNWMTSVALARGSSTRFSLASTLMPSVPSEPTKRRARLNSEVPAEARALERRRRACTRRRVSGSGKPPLDLLGVLGSESPDHAIAGPFQVALRRTSDL